MEPFRNYPPYPLLEDYPSQPSRLAYTEEQIQKLNHLIEYAKQKRHLIVAVRKDFEAYCPVGKIVAPPLYDLERYGTKEIDFDEITEDFVVQQWVVPNENPVFTNELIRDSGIWHYKFDDSKVYPDPNQFHDTDLICKRAPDWKPQLLGTPIGQMYDFIDQFDEKLHDGHAFYWASLWLEQNQFTIEEAHYWIRAGCIVPDDCESMFADEGLTAYMASRVLDPETGITIGRAVLDGIIRVEYAKKLLESSIGFLGDALTLHEAATSWNLNPKELEAKIEKTHANKESIGMVRKTSDGTWLILRSFMFSNFGEPSSTLRGVAAEQNARAIKIEEKVHRMSLEWGPNPPG